MTKAVSGFLSTLDIFQSNLKEILTDCESTLFKLHRKYSISHGKQNCFISILTAATDDLITDTIQLLSDVEVSCRRLSNILRSQKHSFYFRGLFGLLEASDVRVRQIIMFSTFSHHLIYWCRNHKKR